MVNIENVLKKLSQLSPNIKAGHYFGVDQVDLAEEKLGVVLEPSLKEIYKFFNGGQLLEYCFLGCSKNINVDIAYENIDIWELNPFLKDQFVSFLSTSGCELFGYLPNQKDKEGNVPVGYIENYHESTGGIVISSSLNLFFDMFLEKILETVKANKNSLFLKDQNWPQDLKWIFKRDRNLKSRYLLGDFEFFYSHDQNVSQRISKILKL